MKFNLNVIKRQTKKRTNRTKQKNYFLREMENKETTNTNMESDQKHEQSSSPQQHQSMLPQLHSTPINSHIEATLNSQENHGK